MIKQKDIDAPYSNEAEYPVTTIECLQHSTVKAAIFCVVSLEGSQKAAAKGLGISPQYLSDIMNERRDITDAVAAKFGLRKICVFVPRNTEYQEKKK